MLKDDHIRRACLAHVVDGWTVVFRAKSYTAAMAIKARAEPFCSPRLALAGEKNREGCRREFGARRIDFIKQRPKRRRDGDKGSVAATALARRNDQMLLRDRRKGQAGQIFTAKSGVKSQLERPGQMRRRGLEKLCLLFQRPNTVGRS